MHRISIFASSLAFTLALGCGTSGGPTAEVDFSTFEWTEINADAPWAARAGLHVVELGGRFYLMGGRTPLESLIPGFSTLWADVWASDDEGASWTNILQSDAPGHWTPRAYFQAVSKGDSMYVVGGQDFGAMSAGTVVAATARRSTSATRTTTSAWTTTSGGTPFRQAIDPRRA